MEAVGAAAAIAELSGLSLRAGKAAKSLMQSFAHAPEEIIELNTKLERLRIMVQQIEILCAELPTTESHILLPSEHRVLLTFSLQRTLDSLTSLKSAAQTPERQGVRERLRWAALDKKKAQRFLQDVRSAELELDFILQILSVRLSSINQCSIATLAASQNSLHAALTQSMGEVKTWISKEISRVQPTESSQNHAAAIQSWRPRAAQSSEYREEQDDPIKRLMEHDARRTVRYHAITVGNTAHRMVSGSESSSAMAAASISRKRAYTKANLVISLGCRLFGESVLKFELQVSVKCRSWSFGPRLASYFTILNLRSSQSPIFVACRQQNLEEVRYLIQSGQASVRDIDEGTGGLLEHVISGRIMDTNLRHPEHKFARSGQHLLEYLLDQGADPSLYLEGSKNRRPAVLAAFEQSYTTAVASMISHGADLTDLGSQLAGAWQESTNGEAFIWKVRLLGSLGYSDWQTKESVDNLLYGACWHRSMDLVLFALEVVRIDPNLTGGLDRAPLGNAAQIKWLEGVAVLIEAGARPNISNGSWNGTPLSRSTTGTGLLSETSQYLLFRGAEPNLCDSRGTTVWNECWRYLGSWWDVSWKNNVSFVEFEGSLAHLLHHSADPSEIFTATNSMSFWGKQLPLRWYEKVGYTRASDASRFWSYGIGEQLDKNDLAPNGARLNPDSETWKKELDLAESTRELKWTFRWDRFGNINRSDRDGSGEDTYPDDTTSIYSDDNNRSKTHNIGNDDLSKDTISMNNSYRDRTDGTDNSVYSSDLIPANGSINEFPTRASGFFHNATAFYRHISNEQGRRQLSRFPMVRALCDALQHAGFRAEMDDDGDIWYDCDDGDRYFDAWEAPIDDADPAVWLPKVCPICRDFPGYSLGHVLERVERAKQQYHEYKEQVRQGKRALYI